MADHPIFWLAARCQEWRFEGGWTVPVPDPQVYLVMGIHPDVAFADLNARRWINYTLDKIRTETDLAA